jgi:hypothetical protein
VKRFDGWEPEQTTVYEYDDAGRLVRAVTTSEPAWDEQSQAEMLALAEYRAMVHDACGGYLPDTTAADADEAYRAEKPVRCHLCTARAQAHAAYMEAPSPHPEALLWPVRRK